MVPTGPCRRCKKKKVGCSLMPINKRTGKTDRRALPVARLLAFRIKQKNAKAARESSGTSAEVPSPLAPLANLTLDSGPSSTNTPIDSPSIAPLPPLPEGPGPAPSTASSAARTPADGPTPRAARAARKAGRPSTSRSSPGQSDSNAPLSVPT